MIMTAVDETVIGPMCRVRMALVTLAIWSHCISLHLKAAIMKASFDVWMFFWDGFSATISCVILWKGAVSPEVRLGNKSSYNLIYMEIHGIKRAGNAICCLLDLWINMAGLVQDTRRRFSKSQTGGSQTKNELQTSCLLVANWKKLLQ